MRGLDPRIHAAFTQCMDCRVKPGNDDSKSLRGLGGRRGALGGGAALHQPHRPNRAFIECPQREGERTLAENVGRGEYGGDDKGNNDEVG